MTQRKTEPKGKDFPVLSRFLARMKRTHAYGNKDALKKERAKISLQEAKLAAMRADDPLRKHEERILRSMRLNAATAESLLGLGEA